MFLTYCFIFLVGSNRCDGNDCSHLCLPVFQAGDSNARVCACPDGSKGSASSPTCASGKKRVIFGRKTTLMFCTCTLWNVFYMRIILRAPVLALHRKPSVTTGGGYLGSSVTISTVGHCAAQVDTSWFFKKKSTLNFGKCKFWLSILLIPEGWLR